MAAGATDEATLARYSKAQARLESRGGYLWRSRASTMAHGLGFRDEDLERQPRHVLGRPADARVAGARARDRRRRAAARRAHEPSRHRLAGMARADAGRARRGGRARRPRPLVPGGRRDGGARAPGRPLALLRRHAGRSGARSRRRARSRSARRSTSSRRRSSAWSASSSASATRRRRPNRHSRASRSWRRSSASSAIRRTARRWSSASRRRSAPGRVIFELRGRARGDRRSRRSCCSTSAELWLERGEHVTLVGPNGTGKTTLIETLAGRRALAAGKLSTGHNVKVGYLSQHADEIGAGGDANQSVLDAAQRATKLTPNKARALLGPLPVLGRGGRETAGGPVGRRAPPPVAGDPGPVRRERADPGRAHEPPRHREPRGAGGRAAGVPRRGAARLARPRAAGRGRARGRWRWRRARCAATRAAGRSTRAFARKTTAFRVLSGAAHAPPQASAACAPAGVAACGDSCKE